MRPVLAFLLCFVLLESQVLAIWGGPTFGVDGTINVSGTYSGVLIPSSTTPNTLGIFSVGVPTKGFASGAVFVFNDGRLFQGSMVGVMDPGEKNFNAIIHAVHVTSIAAADGGIGGGSFLSLTYDASADGLLNADLEASTTTLLALRLSGNASTQIVNYTVDALGNVISTAGGSFDFTVDGFLQSKEVDTAGSSGIAGLLSGSGV